jgi:hypothetical protein
MNRDIMEASAGYNGAEFISDTAQHIADTCTVYTCLQVISDASISQFTTDAKITGNAFTGILLTAGTIIYGRFTSITLISGQVLAYKGV